MSDDRPPIRLDYASPGMPGEGGNVWGIFALGGFTGVANLAIFLLISANSQGTQLSIKLGLLILLDLSIIAVSLNQWGRRSIPFILGIIAGIVVPILIFFGICFAIMGGLKGI